VTSILYEKLILLGRRKRAVPILLTFDCACVFGCRSGEVKKEHADMMSFGLRV